MSLLSAVFAVAVLSSSPAFAADCATPPTDWIEAVRTKGKREAYLCIAQEDAAGPALLQVIQADGFDEVDGKERVTRAMAIHLVHRLDRALTGEEARALSPADRRLLRDGVYARRGRPSPSPEHDAVFRQFDWYQPSKNFTNGRLTEQDRENIAMIDNPPKAPKPEPAPSAADAMAETNTPRPPPPPGSPPPPEGAPPPDDMPPGPAEGAGPPGGAPGGGPGGPGAPGAGPGGPGAPGGGPGGPGAPGAGGPPPPGGAAGAQESAGCGCSATPTPGAIGLLGLPLLLGLVRRRQGPFR